MKYAESLKYLKFASIGLYFIHHDRPAVMRSFGQSVKIIQYQYCMLPIVIPELYRADCDTDEFFFYDPEDPRSIVDAVRTALASPHKTAWRNGCLSWRQVTDSILSDLRASSSAEAK